MKIILEGTEAELRSALHSFGVQDKDVSDDGSQFLCADIAIRGHRCKTAKLGFMSDSNNSEIKALTQEQANRRREIRNSTSHADLISNIVREYSKRYSESLQGNLSDKAVEKISSIMALFVGASLAEATEVTEHVKNIVLNELPKHTEVTL